ncbi:HAMP domain-containing sensor histidine kinase [Spirosoma utsteinense]|uniref:histidine kinase n=1 Tax=Spirosoma utsteinense TaxID=2585773 RepID=A0ABR6W938_9BACT|nr:ATP-binding protein [Spirosoma utsteinense]MBC3787358.1 PAS domain S-box-containing protein [Spirosoma utsteinense]MBC3793088.1 PAS domain S-box-containing protein [Spirosoma utsteinense]
MTLKAKVSSALFFLFMIILLLSGLSAYYLDRLADDSQAILTDNYVSLEFVSNMQKAIADRTDPDAMSNFETNLKKQEQNTTEVGEKEATQAVRQEFNRLRSGQPTDPATLSRIQQNLFRIDDFNRQAIIRKNETAKQTAKDALLWLEIVGTLCVLILLSFIINFPGYIANPLHELTRGIKQIASRNFEERLHFRSSDEYGELARSFNSMAQKLDEYEHSSLARVLFEKRRIDTLIQIMSEGIIGLDENRRVLFANPVICRLLGTTEHQLTGKYAPDVAASNDLMRTLVQPLMASALAPAEDSGLLKIYDEGRESYFNKRIHTVDVTRTGEEQAQLAGYVIVLENITSYKELDLAKTNFIATVSHELKTPLSSIKMSLTLLNDNRIGQLNDEQKLLVGNVRDDADRLLNLTSELLNMAQVESGQIQLNLQPVVPAEVIHYAISALQTQVDQKRLNLQVHIPTGLPPVLADPDKASWVLINFLSNAVRHSPGEALIEVSAQVRDGYVEFRVRDHGAGIRPEHQLRVFDRYFKASAMGHAQGNEQTSGTGLGLAISSEFIQSMNGQIGLDTSVIDGASFYFRLAVV